MISHTRVQENKNEVFGLKKFVSGVQEYKIIILVLDLYILRLYYEVRNQENNNINFGFLGGFEMLLTVKETAELLRISERYTYQLIKKNKLPHIKLGGKILCDKQSLIDYLKSIEQASIKKEA